MRSSRDTETSPFSSIKRRLVQATSLASLLAAGSPVASLMNLPTPPSCVDIYTPGAEVPPLPALVGPDLVGEPGLVIYAQDGRNVVELDGCHYRLDRPLELEFGPLPGVQVIVELPESEGPAHVRVSVGDGSHESFEVTGGHFTYFMDPTSMLVLEVTIPGESAPTVPVIVLSPTRDDPSPSN